MAALTIVTTVLKSPAQPTNSGGCQRNAVGRPVGSAAGLRLWLTISRVVPRPRRRISTWWWSVHGRQRGSGRRPDRCIRPLASLAHLQTLPEIHTVEFNDRHRAPSKVALSFCRAHRDRGCRRGEFEVLHVHGSERADRVVDGLGQVLR
jgi:hypothetical protein